MRDQRARAIAHPETPVGKHRAKLFASGSNQIKDAIFRKYYIEAICLVESWISDRLECYLSNFKGKPYAFKTLDNLVRQFEESNEIELNPELKSLVIGDVKVWKDKRNTAAHEMMKIESGDYSSWDERLARNRAPAVDGLKLLRKVDNLITRLKRTAKKSSLNKRASPAVEIKGVNRGSGK